VTVEVRTDAPERRLAPGAVLHASGRADLTVTAARDHNGVLLLRFAEVADRSAAEALRDVVLEADVPEDDPDETDEDAWYEHELVGLRVEDPAGRPLGEVAALQVGTAQDLLVVRRPDGVPRLVPFVGAIVPEVDVAGGRVVVDAPPGLLDDLPE
jgi:16S rRNA processing protein RimM